MGVRSWITWRGKNIALGFIGRLLWPRASACCLVVEDGKLLAIDTGSYMMLPGGGIDYGERFEDTALRETREETGIEVEIVSEISQTVNSVGGEERIYQARLKNGEKDLKSYWEGEPVWIEMAEVDEYRWRHDRDLESLLDSIE